MCPIYCHLLLELLCCKIVEETFNANLIDFRTGNRRWTLFSSLPHVGKRLVAALPIQTEEGLL